MKASKDKLDVLFCVNGLIHYAVERQAGFENHQVGNIGIDPQQRNDRTRELIKGMAGQYGYAASCGYFLSSFDERLVAARGSFGIEILPQPQQRVTVQSLLHYARDLANQPSDSREQMLLVSDHLEDMVTCLSWDAKRNGLYPARDWLDRELPKITAQQNILFTRILLGSERGPAMSDFVGGAVTCADAVADTYLYADLSGQYPDIEVWPAVCTVYRGGYEMRKPKDATELDLGIMRRYGNSFVELEGVSVCCYPTEFTVQRDQAQGMTGMDMYI